MTTTKIEICRKMTSFLRNSSTFAEIVTNAAIQIHNSSDINMKTNGEAFFARKLLSIMDSQSIIIDVGTNVGDFLNLFISKESGFQGQIIAIDPLSENLLSAKNRFEDRIEQIIWVEGAATNFDGEIDFYKHVDRYFSGGDSLKPMTTIGFKNLSEKVSVKAVMLSTLIEKYFGSQWFAKEKVFFCKIDVEGAELLVLEGGKRLLEKDNGINVIQFEFGISSRAFKTYFIDIFEFLKDCNFETFILHPDCLKSIKDPILIDLNYPYGNFVALKKSIVQQIKSVVPMI